MYGIGPLPLTDIFRINKMLNVSNHQKVFSAEKAENQKVILAEKSFLSENRNVILAKSTSWYIFIQYLSNFLEHLCVLRLTWVKWSYHMHSFDHKGYYDKKVERQFWPKTEMLFWYILGSTYVSLHWHSFIYNGSYYWISRNLSIYHIDPPWNNLVRQ